MMDVHSTAIRSKNMRAIRSKNTKPEMLVRKALHAAGFRFRLHQTNLPGKPDIVLPKYRSVIFINGCFWHGHACKYFKLPQTRPEFWLSKIESNRTRDACTIEKLTQMGWHVIIIWECIIRSEACGLPKIISRVNEHLSALGTYSAASVTTISI